MHDGAFKTLKDVIEFYNQGGIPNEDLDPLIKPLNLSNDEQRRFTRLFKQPNRLQCG